MKKGFTLAEMLIALGVMGGILAITIPVAINSGGNQVGPLFKSAFKNTETLVGDLINDVSLYPAGKLTEDTFCNNFFSKLNTVGTVDDTTSTIPDAHNAPTPKGMRW